jgi:UDP-N-acetylmuramoylalanine--D-glutamate ligase
MYTPGMFKGKKITIMGLGLLGRGVGDIRFFAEEGADIIVTDLKTKEQLAPSLQALKDFKNISYVLGEHRLEDFKNRDLILKAAGVPLDSPYIAEARKNNIPIEMSTALFARLTPAMIVGITGTRGKSTVTQVLYEVLKKATASPLTPLLHRRGGEFASPVKERLDPSAAEARGEAVNIFLGGNVKGVSTLQFLKNTQEGDIAVLELDSWQLQGFGESKISPHISVFTTFLPDHLNYYRGDIHQYFKDKAHIFAFHTSNDYLILGKDVAETINQQYKQPIQSKIIVAEPELVKDWEILMPGEHNRYNISIVLETAKILGISEDTIKDVVKSFKGIPGRLELVKEYKGIKIYNDTNSTTPDATLAALKAFENPTPLKPARGLDGLRGTRNIVLIFGGADKALDMTKVVEAIPKYCKSVVLLPGTGTEKIKGSLSGVPITEVKTLEEAVTQAFEYAEAGDIVLLSPGFASFGLFKNEFDRGEQFNRIIQELA